MEMINVEKFVAKQKELLEKEREAEISETSILHEQVPLKELQRRGVCLLKLRIGSHHTGLYGRTVVVFEPYWPGKELPSHNFTPGDIAGVQLSQGAPSPSEQLTSGIVSRVTSNSVCVAFEESYDNLDLDDNIQYKLLKLANDVTYKRIKKALDELERSGAECNSLVNVLFGLTEPGPPLSKERDGKIHEIFHVNTRLDESQKEAVNFALHQRELAIVHGPPGTGKTTTVTEIILQAVKQGLKLLVCAPSNIAVDNLVEKLAQYNSRMVRIGHPARVLPSIQRYALDAVLTSSDESQLVEDVRKDIDKSLSEMRKTSNKGTRQRLKDELRQLRKELRSREEKAVKEILQRADVVLATLTMATTDGKLKYLDKQHFDLIIIDECSQALEAACWIALQKAPRCILAGDHNQLPPTILSTQAAKEGLELTLMERLLKLHGDQVMCMLTTQYRMHEDIMTWPSQQLYKGKLTAHKSVAKHLLRDLPAINSMEMSDVPLLLIDTAGCDLKELCLSGELSKGNEGEADIVAYHVQKLVDMGLAEADIAVIAPYNLQVELIRLRLSQKYPKLEIRSVDGFQGREKEAVVISMVRSNEKGEVGFLSEDRRINVAVTRARRHLAVVCDSDTVSRHDFLKSLVDYMNEKGEVRSAQEYIEAGALQNDCKRPDYLDEQMEYNKSTPAPDKPQPETRQKLPQTKKQQKLKNKNQPKPLSDEPLKTKPENKARTSNQSDISDSSPMEWPEERIQHHIVALLVDEEVTCRAFPASLTSKERRIVHEISERLGLVHVSRGEGTDRHIVVTKPDNKPAKDISPAERLKSVQGQNDISAKAGKPINDKTEKSSMSNPISTEDSSLKEPCSNEMGAFKICDKCSKEIPTGNYELHSLRCSGPKQDSVNTGVKPKLNKPKPPKSAKKPKIPAFQSQEEDFDALIAEAVKQNTSCHVSKCKNNAATLGMNCLFCAQRFCLTHHIAEAHGCGDAAKTQARIMISKEGALYRGSGIPSKKPDPTRRANLERKLNSRLSDMEEKRKPKKKDPK